MILEPEDDKGSDEKQGELFAGLGSFVRVDQRDGDWRFKRRRVLLREER